MIKKLSPAKVNLHLKVLRKRGDGYHDIATLLQKISLYDEIHFHTRKEGIALRCPDSSLPENADNLVYRAAQALFARASYTGGIEITVIKHIPVAAGLGGGSSDAATVLTTLNDMLGFNYPDDELMKMGVKLGADVPFFIAGNAAWAFGIGDRLKAAENIPFLWFVLVNPRVELSTKLVYEKLNLRLTKKTIHYKVPRFYTTADLISGLHNDLEMVTLSLHPALQRIKDLLVEFGALGALVSGSGPTVFGVFEKEEAARKAEEALKKAEADAWSVFLAHSLG